MLANAQLRKAARFYELAYTFQQRARLESNTFFTLVTFNNLAQIFQSLEEEDIANNHFRHMISVLMFSIYRSNIEGSSISAAIVEAFLENSCHLLLLGVPPTASAA